jgi:hypothetical protein
MRYEDMSADKGLYVFRMRTSGPNELVPVAAGVWLCLHTANGSEYYPTTRDDDYKDPETMCFGAHVYTDLKTVETSVPTWGYFIDGVFFALPNQMDTLGNIK